MCDSSVLEETARLTEEQVIAFWEEYGVPVWSTPNGRRADADSNRYLEREFLATYQNSRIVLLRPAMSFMLLQTPDPRVIAVREHLHEAGQ